MKAVIQRKKLKKPELLEKEARLLITKSNKLSKNLNIENK